MLKLGTAIRIAKQALAEGKAPIIGLQSTGEAALNQKIKSSAMLEEMKEICAPRKLLVRCIKRFLPLPPAPLGVPEEKIANDLNYEYDHKNIGEVSCEKVGKDMHTRESCRQHGGFNSGDLGRNLLGKNAGIHCNDKEPSGIALNSDSSDFDDDVDDDYNTDLDGFLAADDEDDSVRCDRERHMQIV